MKTLSRFALTVGYTLGFWIILPALLLGSGFFADKALVPHGATWFWAGAESLAWSSAAVLFAALCMTAVIQFHLYSGELPVSAFRPARLVQRGLYIVWRHPIYLFYSLALVCVGPAAHSVACPLMVMPVFIALTLVYAWREEQGLIRRFGARYTRYRRETPLIIPRLPNVLRLPGALVFKMLFGLTVNGRENIPEESPFVVVSTHRCYLDPFFIAVAVPKPIHFVTTFEVFRKRRTAWLFRRFLSIPRKRFRADTESQRAVARLIRGKGIVGLFAEGERSWTGSPQPFKPEAIRFLTLFDGLLVLPIRIDGNFSAWPRWAPRFHRAKVTVTVQEALRMGKGMTAAILEKNLLAATMPHDSESRCRGQASARGITAVLYRCPECKVFRSLEAHAVHAVLCAACGAKLSVSPCCRISWSSAGKWHDLELDEVYQRIRIAEADMASARELQGTGPGLSDGSLMNNGTLSTVSTAARAGIFRLEPGERLVAGAGAVRFSRESGQRFSVTGARSLLLTDRRLLAFGDTLAADVALDALSSVTTESNRKLQLYDGRQRHLYQAEFAEDSVLLWQDCIVAAVRFFFGRSVNTR